MKYAYLNLWALSLALGNQGLAQDKRASDNVSLRSEGPEVLWNTTGGSISQDNRQSLFRQDHTGGILQLLRMDLSSGLSQWQYTAKENGYLLNNCSDENQVFVLENHTLRALSQTTGQSLWTHTDNFFSQPEMAVSCPFGANVFYTSGYGQDLGIHAVDRATGASVWENNAMNGLILDQDKTNLYISSAVNTHPSLVALDLETGATRWTRAYATGHLEQDREGAMYAVDGTKLTAIDANGKDLWVYRGGSGGLLNVLFRENHTALLLEDNRLSRLDTLTGRVLWTFEHPAPGKDFLATASLNNHGSLQYWEMDYAAGKGKFVRLDESTGKMLWSLSDLTASPGLNVFEDGYGHFFMYDARSIRSLALESGRVIWQYQLVSENAAETIFGLDSNAETLVVTTGVQQGRYPPMGLRTVAIASGIEGFSEFEGEVLDIQRIDADRLIITKGLKGEAKAFAL